MSALAIGLTLGLATAVQAQQTACPAVPDNSALTSKLLARIQAAPNEGAARDFTRQMWEIWLEAPDEKAQLLLDTGLSSFRAGDLATAWDFYTQLIRYCPHYAEGYNQRAFVAFLRNDFEPALADLDRALARNPTHVGALSGRALTLFGLGRDEDGQAALREAVALNPWLSERHLLVEPEGEEL